MDPSSYKPDWIQFPDWLTVIKPKPVEVPGDVQLRRLGRALPKLALMGGVAFIVYKAVQ